MLTRWVAAVEYDGSRYCGWQKQPKMCSVQTAVERALSAIAGHDVHVTCAGRTDAGVHAFAQIIHFDTHAVRPVGAWVKGVNAHLPHDISVLWAMVTERSFHARFSAIRRHYTYVLRCHAVRSALFHHRVGWCYKPLDLSRMQQAALFLIGYHDFSSFRAARCQAKQPFRDLSRLDITQKGCMVYFHFSADGFLYHMVRIVVGSLVLVGRGVQSPEWLADVLHAKNRTCAAPTFAASGLYLEFVDYPHNYCLPCHHFHHFYVG